MTLIPENGKIFHRWRKPVNTQTVSGSEQCVGASEDKVEPSHRSENVSEVFSMFFLTDTGKEDSDRILLLGDDEMAIL